MYCVRIGIKAKNNFEVSCPGIGRSAQSRAGCLAVSFTRGSFFTVVAHPVGGFFRCPACSCGTVNLFGFVERIRESGHVAFFSMILHNAGRECGAGLSTVMNPVLPEVILVIVRTMVSGSMVVEAVGFGKCFGSAVLLIFLTAGDLGRSAHRRQHVYKGTV